MVAFITAQVQAISDLLRRVVTVDTPPVVTEAITVVVITMEAEAAAIITVHQAAGVSINTDIIKLNKTKHLAQYNEQGAFMLIITNILLCILCIFVAFLDGKGLIFIGFYSILISYNTLSGLLCHFGKIKAFFGENFV